ESCKEGRKCLLLVQKNTDFMVESNDRCTILRFLSGILLKDAIKPYYPTRDEMDLIMFKFMVLPNQMLDIRAFTTRTTGWLQMRMGNAQSRLKALGEDILDPAPKRPHTDTVIHGDSELENQKFQASIDGTAKALALELATRNWRMNFAKKNKVEDTICSIRQVVTAPRMIMTDLESRGIVTWDANDSDALTESVESTMRIHLGEAKFNGIEAADQQTRVAYSVIEMLNKISGSKRLRRDRSSIFIIEFTEGTDSSDALKTIAKEGLLQPTLYRMGVDRFKMAFHGREITLHMNLLPSIHTLIGYCHYFGIQYTPSLVDVYQFYEKLMGVRSGKCAANALTLFNLVRS
ncbi:hypothetical protein PFISCL1PPCAC_5113, partial [Pristionchus fissidentatus]